MYSQRPQVYMVPTVPGMRWCLGVAIAVIVVGTLTGRYELVGPTMLTHFILAAMWSALGPGELYTRYLRSLGWVLLQIFAFAIGQIVVAGHRPDELLSSLMCVSTSILISTAITLGLVQLCFLPFSYWWRIDYPSQGDGAHVWQFKMRHLLVATTVIAALFGLGRYLLSGWQLDDPGQWLPVVLVCGTLLLPAVVLLPVLRSPTLKHSLAAVAVLVGPPLLLEAGWELLREEDGPRFLLMMAMHAIGVAWTLAIGILWRRSGLRFVYWTERLRYAEDVSYQDSVSFEFLEQPVGKPSEEAS